MTPTPSEIWYPVANGTAVVLEVHHDAPSGYISEHVAPTHPGATTWGVRFPGPDSAPGFDLSNEIVQALASDGQGPIGHGQRITPERLNAAVERATRQG